MARVTEAKFTAREKYDEATRELAMRIRHYPNMVDRGTLTEPIARKRIAIMHEIAEDYRKWAEANEPSLFG